MKKENERKMWNGKINKCVRKENKENLEEDDVEEAGVKYSKFLPKEENR